MPAETIEVEQRDGKRVEYQVEVVDLPGVQCWRLTSPEGRAHLVTKRPAVGMFCTCLDQLYRGGECKHIRAVEAWLGREKT